MHGVHTKRGFTLIELLVVIAIIGILATIVIIQLAGAQTRARNSNAQSDVTEMGKAVETWKTTNTDTVPNAYTFTAAAAGTTVSGTTLANGWTALFNTSGAFPVTVTKSPSGAYTYGYTTSATTTTAANVTTATATSNDYCVSTDLVNAGGVTGQLAFFINDGGNASGAGVTPTFSVVTGKCS